MTNLMAYCLERYLINLQNCRTENWSEIRIHNLRVSIEKPWYKIYEDNLQYKVLDEACERPIYLGSDGIE